MEIRQIQYFLAVAKNEHVTRAAEGLHVAQSAVSRQIKLLEAELGVPLFLREGKRVFLSPFGLRFVSYAEQIVNATERAKQLANQFNDPCSGTIRVGFPHSLGASHVPEIIAKYRETQVHAQFEPVQARATDLVQALYRGDLDVAWIAGNPSLWEEHNLKSAFLFNDPLVAVLPKNHRYAGKQILQLRDLESDAFIHFQPGFTLRQHVDQIFQSVGFSPTVALEADETDVIRGFVAAGLGVSILPKSSVTIPGTVEIPFKEPLPQRTVSLVWWRNEALSSLAKHFIQFVIASTSPNAGKSELLH